MHDRKCTWIRIWSDEWNSNNNKSSLLWGTVRISALKVRMLWLSDGCGFFMCVCVCVFSMHARLEHVFFMIGHRWCALVNRQVKSDKHRLWILNWVLKWAAMKSFLMLGDNNMRWTVNCRLSDLMMEMHLQSVAVVALMLCIQYIRY